MHIALFLEVRAYPGTATCRDRKYVLKWFVSKSLNLLLSLPAQAASQTRITAGMKALAALREQRPNVFNVLPHEEGREQAGQE